MEVRHQGPADAVRRGEGRARFIARADRARVHHLGRVRRGGRRCRRADACEGLEGSQAATTIRVDGNGRHVTDGPFMETKEQLGGFIFLEVRDLDEAMEWAARTPWNEQGHVTEIRPVMDYDQYAARVDSAGEERAAS